MSDKNFDKVLQFFLNICPKVSKRFDIATDVQKRLQFKKKAGWG